MAAPLRFAESDWRAAGFRIPDAHGQFAHVGVADETLQAAVIRRRSGSVRAGECDNACTPARKLAFGEYVETRYNFEKADMILSLDGDFLSRVPRLPVYYARLGEPPQSRCEKKDVRASTRSRARRRTPAARPTTAAGDGLGSGAVRALCWQALGAGGGGNVRPERSRSSTPW